MQIALQEIQFKWDPANHSSSAIPVRKNATETVRFPEWEAGQVNTFDTSVAVYAIHPTVGNKILLKAQFSTIVPALLGQEVEIRAVQPPVGSAYNPYLNPYLNYIQAVLSTPVNVLGEVKAKKVRINANGETASETFELINERLAQRGVGISRIVWFWQYRLSVAQAWQTIGVTEHKVYTILDIPRGPWVQTSGDNRSLPWTEVLDFACTWADRAQTFDQASAMITNAVYQLGPLLLEYNCSNFLPAYIIPVNILGDSYFDCTAFLLHLKTGRINRYVICTDCATIVSTFANILGCNLWQSKMYTPGVTFFKVNPVLAIGSFQFGLPCNLLGFSFHEVAWNDGCTAEDEVYDACLAIDRDLSPSLFPHWAYLPANLEFGQAGSGLYRDRLAAPTDILLCAPQPGDRQRRKLFPEDIVVDRALDTGRIFYEDRAEIIKKEAGFSRWAGRNKLPESFFLHNYDLPDEALGSWQRLYEKKVKYAPGMLRINNSFWRYRPTLGQQAIKVTQYECASRQEAHEFVTRLLAEAHVTPVYQEIEAVGDIAFASPGFNSIIFARGNMVVSLTNADSVVMNLLANAQAIDRSFYEKTETPAIPETEAPVAIIFDEDEPATPRLRIDPVGKTAARSRTLTAGEPEVSEVNNLKLFAGNGEFRMEDGQIVFIPEPARAVVLEIFGEKHGKKFRTTLQQG